MLIRQDAQVVCLLPADYRHRVDGFCEPNSTKVHFTQFVSPERPQAQTHWNRLSRSHATIIVRFGRRINSNTQNRNFCLLPLVMQEPYLPHQQILLCLVPQPSQGQLSHFRRICPFSVRSFSGLHLVSNEQQVRLRSYAAASMQTHGTGHAR